jgi:hypothetical protein
MGIWGGVKEYIQEGNLGLAPTEIIGTVLTIGVADGGNEDQLYYIDRNSNVKDIFTAGPLCRRLLDSIAAGAKKIIAMKLAATTEGGYRTVVVKTGTGPDTVTYDGPANERYRISVKITLGGAVATAKFKVSTDGGDSWGDEQTTAATYEIPDTGVTVNFAVGTFVVDDLYNFEPECLVGTGEATAAFSETPNDRYEVVIKIVGSGALADVDYQYSLDGGITYSPKYSMPTDGIIAIAGTGITVTFTEAGTPADSFDDGDEWHFDTIAPLPSISDVTSALDFAKANCQFEFAHIVGEMAKTSWTTLGTYADAMFEEHKPMFFILEAPEPDVGESATLWANRLISEQDGFGNKHIKVVAGRGEIGDRYGNYHTDCAAGIVAGLNSKVPVMRSVGNVEHCAITNVTKLTPLKKLDRLTAISEAQLIALDEARYDVLRSYQGLTGFYVANGNLMAPPTSDYQYSETLRTMYKGVRLARARVLAKVHAEADNLGLKDLENHIEDALSPMERDREVERWDVEIPEGQDVVTTGNLDVMISFVQIGIMRTISLWFSIKLS